MLVTFSIDASHPSLPGHFPDRPVVPGVLLLDQVAAGLERECGLRITKLPTVKFLRPLLPNESAQVTIDRDGDNGRFVIECNGDLVAKGNFEVGA